MRNIRYGILAILSILTCLLPLTIGFKAEALSGSSFQAGNIISDSVFTNYNAMSANDVQTFLSAQMPNCDTNGTKPSSHPNGSGGYYTRAQWGAIYNANNNTTSAAAPYVCLKDYVENPSTAQNNLQNPGLSISGGMSAAQIIVNRAVQYHINPQVLVTTLQKEQALVTDDWPWTTQYQKAMGYGCPDTPPGCNSSYAGFYNQVDRAARQFRYYLDHPNAYNYWIGDNVIAYSPTCSGTHVTIQNAATAALYIYTPYQPNAAVLAATNPTGSTGGPGPSVSGNCGGYGNRNFWWYFNTWFGSSSGDLVKAVGDNTVYLLSGTKAYPIYDVNVLNDLAVFGPVRTTTLGEINSYSGGPPVQGLIGSNGGTLYLLNASIKLPFNDCNSVADYGYVCDSTKIPYLTDGQLQKLVNGPPVTPLLKAVSNPTVYYVSGGNKRPIANWSAVQSLHISVMNTLTNAFVDRIPYNGSFVYGSGALVKTANSPLVYVVKDTNSLMPIDSFVFPSEFGLSTNVTTIASNYVVLGNLENKIKCSGVNYLATNQATYSVAAGMLTNYGFSAGQFSDGGILCHNIPLGTQALTQFIRVANGTIYYVSSGQKQAFTSYEAYQAHGGTSANTLQVSNYFAGTLANGAPINS